MTNVVTEVAKSEGDVREVVELAKRVIQAGYDNLLVPILGMNDYWIEAH